MSYRPARSWSGARSAALATLVVLLLPPSSSVAQESGFPLADLQPKSETGVADFLREHPKYDGRGVIVAIFDTGIDPGAPGLQVTSDGKPKIIDLIDGSGSGDVPTTTIREADDGKLEGLSGRELKLGKWKNPSGEYHVGLKPAWELYPRSLVVRMKAYRREAWDAEQRERVAAARQELDEWDAENPSPTEEQLRRREELSRRVGMLEELQEDYDDPGPVFDCVVFHDGDDWRAVIDTDEDGDLSDEKAMTNFRKEREWSTFDDESLLNFGVNIYDDGNLLSIVADCGAHGTHVAGITAANYPDRPDLNGMAPGAQLVAVKIGDTRRGSSSFGTGPARGIVAALENGVDIVNMSYGGAAPLPNYGHDVDFYEQFIYEEGVIFVSTAGNAGPALTTVGGPGGTNSATIGVGAYVSSDMMTAQYSLREKLPSQNYTWSSRGPAKDGALSVSYSAPGGAITTVPNWTLQGNTLMNGTSMAAPSVAGGIACLLSGLKDRGIAWTPQHVNRVLENTAAPIAGMGPLDVGRGLVRIDRAWDHLVKYEPFSTKGVEFEVTIAARNGDRGIYLREKNDLIRPTEVRVTVSPRFHRDVDNREKVDFEFQVAIHTDADWVEVPAHLHMHAGGRTFRILVDPMDLPPGVHYAEIVGTDTADPDRGAMFRIPVTVIKPHELTDAHWKETIRFTPGEIERRFFHVPDGATWADLVIRGGDHATDRRAIVHCVQIEPGMAWNAHQLYVNEWMTDGEEQVRSFEVMGGRTLEVCLAQYWSSLGDSEFEFELTLHGLPPSERNLMLDGSVPAHALTLTSPIRDEMVSPSGRLEHRRRTIRPVDWELRPLPGKRDLMPDDTRIHELILTYEYEVEEDDEEVRILPALAQHDRFWEYWQSGLWMLFDESKQLLQTGPTDASTSLKKGKYTIRYHARFPDPDALDGIKNAALNVDVELDSPITVTVKTDEEGAVKGGQAFGSRLLSKGETATLWVVSPVWDELPDGVAEGDLLYGSIEYGESRDGYEGSGHRPGGFPLSVRVPAAPIEKEDPEPADEEEEDESETLLADELRDLSVTHLGTLRGDRGDDFNELAERLERDHPDHLPIQVERMRFAADDEDADPDDVVAACDAVVSRIDAEAVAATLGVDIDPDDKEQEKHRDEMKEQKDWLVEALRTKCEALQKDDDAADAFEAAFRELDRWAETTDEDHAALHVERERRRGRIAMALDTLNDRIEEDSTNRELLEQRAALYEELGWGSWAQHERQWLLLRMPPEWPAF